MENNLKIVNNSFDLYENGGSYINHFRFFHGVFNTIPNLKSASIIDTEKAKNHIQKKYQANIASINYNQDYKTLDKVNYERDYFIVFNEALLINFYNDFCYVLFDQKNEKLADEIIKDVLPFIKKARRNKAISFIITVRNSLQTRELAISKPNVNIDLHYNDDFKTIHDEVLKTLRKPKTKGLFLFHGKPGTGKSTYLKHLIHHQKKEVIFLSPKMAANLDNMAFTEFLLDNPNIILVIEDAEELIVSRDNHGNSHLSFLLNLTDGLIADSLGIQIIATFNTDVKNIDKALLRKGRLTAIYEFKELTVKKANELSKHLGLEYFDALQPMSLADIFNYKETNFSIGIEKVKIGF